MTMAPAPSSVASCGNIVQSLLMVVLIVFVTAVLTIAIRLVLHRSRYADDDHDSRLPIQTTLASGSAIHASGVEIGPDLRDSFEIGSEVRTARASRSRSSIHAVGESFRVEISSDRGSSFEIGSEIRTTRASPRASRSRSSIHAAGDRFPVEIGPDLPDSFEIGSDLQPQRGFFAIGSDLPPQSGSFEIGSDLPPQSDSFEIGSDLRPQSGFFEIGSDLRPQSGFFEIGSDLQPQSSFFEIGSEIRFLPIPSAPLEPEVVGGSGRLSCASSRYLSFRSSGRFFTGSSRRKEIHGLEEEIAEYMDLQW